MPLDAELLALQEACLGRFGVERELGRGGMGVVVLARDLQLDRPVAIKVLPLGLARQTPLRERFLREARTSAGLSHPNIVPIHSVEEHDDVVFFVMGFVDGETLTQRVTRLGPMSPGDATRAIQEVAWALAYAHGRGIVHRDIKPDNVLVERATGRALVTDFGIARVADATRALTLDGHVMGTAQFMSPEQAAGEPIDGRSDLYALGVVGYFAVTGALPFEADSVTALLAMQVTRPAPPVASRRPGLPARLAAAIDRCLAKRPDDRFPNAEALADDLSAVHAPGAAAVPPQVRNFQRTAEQSTLMLFLVVMLSLGSLQGAGDRWWAVLGGPVGAILAVAIDLGRRARQLVLDGFGAGDVVAAFLLEREAREAEVAVIYSAERSQRLGRLRRRAFALAALCIPSSIGVMLARKALHLSRGVTLALTLPFYLVGVVALIVAVNASRRAERRSGAMVARVWTGGFTALFFRLAATGLRPEERAAASSNRGAPVVELPRDVRDRHPALAPLMERVDPALGSLRRREEQMERALAEVGGASSTAPAAPDWSPALGAAGESADTGGSARAGATTHAVLLHRRLSLVSNLRSGLERVRRDRADVIAAHENVRIGLARHRAGLGALADLAPDVEGLRRVLDATDSTASARSG